MLNRLPAQLPPLSLLLDDLGQPSDAAVARALGVSERTVRRWVARDSAPHAALLALYWVTRWGHSAIAADVKNESAMLAGFVACLKTENAKLTATLSKTLALADTGASNLPTWRALPLAPVIELRPRPRTA
jgi:hypothetical protein